MNRVKGVANFMKMLAKSAESVGKQRAARQAPISREEAQLAVLSQIGKGAENVRAGGGFTIDPRTGQMVNLGEQFGFMMSPIKNVDAVQIPYKPNITADEIMAAVPESYWPRLQGGAYLGSWVDDGNIYLDPAERYLTKLASMRAGLKSEQLSGANLRTPMPTDWATQPSPFYDVTPEAYQELLRKRAIQAMSGVAGAGAAGGTAAVLNQD